ncbi:MAG: chloride channel protein [Anaerolineaceae bacterium]|nr:chloride channel protein [Anaerolineaceae bacterium]
MAFNPKHFPWQKPGFQQFIWRNLHPSENTMLLGLSVAVGLTTGIGVWLFRSGITFFETNLQGKMAGEFLSQFIGPFGIVVVLAVAGLVVGWLVNRFIGQERYHGVTSIIESVALSGGRLPYIKMPFKALASALSLGAGASVGPEAPSVVIGANLGSFFGQRLRLSEERVRLLVAAGSASAIADAFRAPIAGVFFALEVVLNGEFNTSSFGVIVLAAVLSTVFTQAVELGGPELGTLNYTLGGPLEIPLYALLGIILAPVAVLFIRVVHWQHDLWEHHVHLSRPLKTALAGVVVGLVGMFLPQILGTGREVMREVLSTTNPAEFTVTLLVALAFGKLLMSAVSIAGGFVGGIFAPALFVGTMLGGGFGLLVVDLVPDHLTSSPQAYAIVGMAAMMAGVVRAPITGILLVFELTNDYRLILPIMLTTVVCVYLTERFIPAGVDTLALLRNGIRLQQGRDVDVMQGITVEEAMVKPAPCIPSGASLVNLRDSLRENRTRALCVTDANKDLCGIVTLTDLQKTYEAGLSEKQKDMTVGDICSRDIVTAYPDDALWVAIRTMGARDIGRLPVVESGTRKLVGMLSRADIVHAYNTAIARKLEHHHRIEQIRLNTLTGAHVVEMHVGNGAPISGHYIKDIHWPAESVVASIRRGNKLLVPHGSTEISTGDTLTMVIAKESEDELAALFGYEVGRE